MIASVVTRPTPQQETSAPLSDTQKKSETVVNRRGLLRLGTAATACVLLPAPALAVIKPRVKPTLAKQETGERRLAFYNLHTGERANTAYWADGSYQPDGLDEINHLLRDFRTGEVMDMDRDLLDLLHRLHGAMDATKPFHVISGYRSPRTNAKLAAASGGVAKRSMHMRGMAIDVRLPGRNLKDLHRAARSLRAGGVGYYGKSNFIHVDVGRVRYW
jgi:uncharacterized protein YcbK (DUF882 family)